MTAGLSSVSRMSASEEHVELLVSPDDGRSTSSRASTHRGHNLFDFDLMYGRKDDDDRKSLRSSLMSYGRGMSCNRDKVLSFIERHVPAINVIRTYKVCGRLFVNICILLAVTTSLTSLFELEEVFLAKNNKSYDLRFDDFMSRRCCVCCQSPVFVFYFTAHKYHNFVCKTFCVFDFCNFFQFKQAKTAVIAFVRK